LDRDDRDLPPVLLDDAFFADMIEAADVASASCLGDGTGDFVDEIAPVW
jgi:hypothetical protein